LEKLIYRFNNQDSQSSYNLNLLGGKGANLAQMAKLKLPVPPGFTISTRVCEYFYENNKKIPKKLIHQTKKEINLIEKISKKKFSISKVELTLYFPYISRAKYTHRRHIFSKYILSRDKHASSCSKPLIRSFKHVKNTSLDARSP
jgi:hypothetical protein